jgi:hypothetical protein
MHRKLYRIICSKNRRSHWKKATEIRELVEIGGHYVPQINVHDILLLNIRDVSVVGVAFNACLRLYLYLTVLNDNVSSMC